LSYRREIQGKRMDGGGLGRLIRCRQGNKSVNRESVYYDATATQVLLVCDVNQREGSTEERMARINYGDGLFTVK
jgi:hypothetical protein